MRPRVDAAPTARWFATSKPSTSMQQMRPPSERRQRRATKRVHEISLISPQESTMDGPLPWHVSRIRPSPRRRFHIPWRDAGNPTRMASATSPDNLGNLASLAPPRMPQAHKNLVLPERAARASPPPLRATHAPMPKPVTRIHENLHRPRAGPVRRTRPASPQCMAISDGIEAGEPASKPSTKMRSPLPSLATPTSSGGDLP